MILAYVAGASRSSGYIMGLMSTFRNGYAIVFMARKRLTMN